MYVCVCVCARARVCKISIRLNCIQNQTSIFFKIVLMRLNAIIPSKFTLVCYHFCRSCKLKRTTHLTTLYVNKYFQLDYLPAKEKTKCTQKKKKKRQKFVPGAMAVSAVARPLFHQKSFANARILLIRISKICTDHHYFLSCFAVDKSCFEYKKQK